MLKDTYAVFITMFYLVRLSDVWVLFANVEVHLLWSLHESAFHHYLMKRF